MKARGGYLVHAKQTQIMQLALKPCSSKSLELAGKLELHCLDLQTTSRAYEVCFGDVCSSLKMSSVAAVGPGRRLSPEQWQKHM